MRRLLAIALVVLFWLPAVSALLPGAQDASLPACCRRNGAHHCVMAMAMRASMARDTGPGFAAPNHCPFYRIPVRATTPSFVFPHFAIAHARGASYLATAPANTSILDRADAHGGRGPPRLS